MAVRIGETYNVVWGKSDDDSDLADILDSGDWLDMRRRRSSSKLASFCLFDEVVTLVRTSPILFQTTNKRHQHKAGAN
jgi:hypothetical protein